MSSFFKKRSSADAKSSSKSSHGTESDSKTQRNASSTTSSKSGAIHGPPSTNTGGGVVPPNSKGTTLSQSRDRKPSLDMQEWLETECPVDSRIMAATMQHNTLSISRSGRFKAKGKLRARLFSEDADGVGSPDDHSSNQAPPRGSTSLATPEDRQTVLDAMAKRPVAAALPGKSPTAASKQGLAGGSPPSNTESGANKKSSDRGSSSKWSTTSNSMDL